MEYDKFMRGCGFWMRRWKHIMHIFTWENLMADMVYDRRLTIWRELQGAEIPNSSAGSSLVTNSTPKLRKMMRRTND